MTWAQTHAAGLWNDDIYNLQEHVAGDIQDLVLRPVALRQFAPGHRLLTELQLTVGPTDRVVMHAIVALAIGLATLTAAMLAARLYRHTWWLPAVILVVVVGPAGLEATSWYAAAYHIVPSLLFGLLGVAAHLRWRSRAAAKTGLPRGMPVASTILVLLGATFSVKALLSPLFLMLHEYVILRPGGVRDTFSRVRGDLITWAPYVLIGVAYLAALQWRDVAPAAPDLAGTGAAVAYGLGAAAVPLLLGLLPATPETLAPLLIGMSWAAVATAAVIALRERRQQGRALMVAVVLVATSVAIPAVVTASSFGSAAGLTPRYHLEGLVYAWLAVAAGTRPLAARRDQPRRPVVAASAWLTVVIVLAGSVAWSNATQREDIGAFQSGAWIATMEKDLAQLPAQQPVLATPLPPFVVNLLPGRRITDLDGIVPGLEVDTHATRVVDAQGHVEVLDARDLSSQVGSEFATNALVSIQGDYEVIGTALCTESDVEVEFLLGPHAEPRLLELEVGGSAALAMEHRALPGRPKDPPYRTEVSGAVARLPLDLLGWSERVFLSLETQDGDPACLERIAVVEVRNDLPQYGDLND